MKKYYILAIVLNFAFLLGCSPKREKINNLQERLDQYYNSEELIIVESKPYTGILFQEFEDGYIQLEVGIKNGIPDGKYELFEEKGLLRLKGILKDGEQDGLWERFPNEKNRVVKATYQMGELVVDWKVYDDLDNIIETDVYNPNTNKIWMDRNLGASRVATSSADPEAYGDLFQWGRSADGHQKRNSPDSSTLSITDTTSHGSFILAPKSPYDWRTPHNNNLWQGVNGVNNPCPVGYRLPTETEWRAERLSWSSQNADGAFNSKLKLPMAGARHLVDGSLEGVGTYGAYWSSGYNSIFDGIYAEYVYFDSSTATKSYGSYVYRASGLTVRCTKD